MRLFQAAIATMGFGLLAFVVVGFLLPGRWETERARQVDVGPDSAWTVISDLSRWQSWSSLGEVDGTLSDPPDSVGSTLEWDDSVWGQGVLRITALRQGQEVEYEVAVDDGDIQTRGRIRLAPGPSGSTDIVWRESGDMGWNPLLAYFALGMDRMQGQELEKALDRLEAVLEGLPMDGLPTDSNTVAPPGSGAGPD